MSRPRRHHGDQHASRNPRIAVLVVAAALAASPTVGCKSAGSDDDRDEYVPPEPDRQQHDAPPRRPHY